MVLHDRGYQRWTGDREGRVPGARVIFARGARTALAQLFRRKLFAQLLSFFAYAPFLFALVFLYALYFFSANAAEFGDTARHLRQSEAFAMVTPSPDTVWGYLLEIQMWVMLALCILVGAGQVAEDRRTNALELYFSRPLTLGQYVLGKLGVVALFLALVSLVPALLLILVQMFLGGAQEGRLPELAELLWRTAAAGSVLVLFGALLVLAISSLALRARSAAVMLAGFLVLLEGLVANLLRESFSSPAVRLVSLHFDLGQVLAWILGNQAERHPDVPVLHAGLVLLGWSLLCLLVIRARVRPVEVVA